MSPAALDVFIHPRFAPDYEQHPLVLVDAGARGGLRSHWTPAARHLRMIGFEPDPREYEKLKAQPPPSTTFFDVALLDTRRPLRLHLARDRGLSSMFEPNREFLDAFPEAGRFDIVDEQEVPADALDNLLSARGIADVDFIKADTQGSELLVLRGAASALASSISGVEVEVEFAPIYNGQPLFADVDAFLRDRGFQLFDLRSCYWKRAAGRALGGPRGQIIWADALYLKGPSALAAMLAQLEPARRKSKLLKAISIALLYGYVDYAVELAGLPAGALSQDEAALVEQQLRHRTSRPAAARVPGRRYLAAALHRLWKAFRSRDDEAWSVSGAHLGNPG